MPCQRDRTGFVIFAADDPNADDIWQSIMTILDQADESIQYAGCFVPTATTPSLGLTLSTGRQKYSIVPQPT